MREPRKLALLSSSPVAVDVKRCDRLEMKVQLGADSRVVSSGFLRFAFCLCVRNFNGWFLAIKLRCFRKKKRVVMKNECWFFSFVFFLSVFFLPSYLSNWYYCSLQVRKNI